MRPNQAHIVATVQIIRADTGITEEHEVVLEVAEDTTEEEVQNGIDTHDSDSKRDS